MPWPVVLLLLIGGITLIILTEMPIAFSFAALCMVVAFMLWGGFIGIQSLTDTIFSSLAQFSYVPLPLFLLMGAIIFEAGIGEKLVDTCNLILGRMPGRLSVIAIAAGTLLATLTGSSTASVAMLAKSLAPQMYEYKYKNDMVLGPLLAGGQLAPMIPPSGMAVFLAGVAGLSVGKLLIAIIVPGLLLATLFAAYCVIRSMIQPDLAPPYMPPPVPLSVKLKAVTFNILPLGIVIFGVIGVLFLGIATPEEAAGSGVVACYILAALHRKLNWQVIKKSAISAFELSVMILIIIAMAMGFAKLLAFSGAVNSLVTLASSLPVAPIVLVIGAQVVVLFLGMPLGPPSIILMTMPIYMPIIDALGYDMVWFGVLVMISCQMSALTPPIGLDVFVLQAFAPKGTGTYEVFRAGYPFLYIALFTTLIIMFFPQVALWLPGLMWK